MVGEEGVEITWSHGEKPSREQGGIQGSKHWQYREPIRNQGLAIYQSPNQLPDVTSCFRSFICEVLNYSSESVSRNSHERAWFEYLREGVEIRVN